MKIISVATDKIPWFPTLYIILWSIRAKAFEKYMYIDWLLWNNQFPVFKTMLINKDKWLYTDVPKIGQKLDKMEIRRSVSTL